mmetsp:Transcript_7401/g.16397  ORF Transcript_7401/g.16397 Transcript_7401/m.16397 type:complete len:274 (-) Transcript_7401:78-899(-)
MSQAERRAEESSSDIKVVVKTRANESPTKSSETSEAKDITIATASLKLDKKSDVAPSSPATPTLETVITGTDSEQSSERGREDASDQPPRQVIAVSVSKGPSAFFNLARKFLVTDESCDLSALEGAIVSAVDAAHLLERSKIATITRIQTSYVSVEPKKRQDHRPSSPVRSVITEHTTASSTPTATEISQGQSSRIESLEVVKEQQEGPAQRDRSASVAATEVSHATSSPGKSKGSSGVLRRARIVITVQRTSDYTNWLKENPVHDVISGEEE